MSFCILHVQKRASPLYFRELCSWFTRADQLRVHVLSKLNNGPAKRHITRQNAPCARNQSQVIQKPRCEPSRHSKTANSRKPNPRPLASILLSSPRSASSIYLKVANMSTSAAPVEDPYRLPTNVKPIHYDITIKTDLESLTFQGLVKVRYVEKCRSAL